MRQRTRYSRACRNSGTKRRPGTCVRCRKPCDWEEKTHETHFRDWSRAIGIDACIGSTRFRQAGDGAHRRAGRRRDSGQRRPRSRAYGPRRARPPLRMGRRTRPSLWLAPSSLIDRSLPEAAFADPLPGRKRIPATWTAAPPGAASSLMLAIAAVSSSPSRRQCESDRNGSSPQASASAGRSC